MSHTDVHLLNVGAGACTVVRSPSGHISMIDINDGQDQRTYETEQSQRELTDPIAWCRANCGDHLFRFILSHPDADHMAGLRRILLERELSVTNFWDLPHNRQRKESDCASEPAWHDWVAYHAMRKKMDVDDISWPTLIEPMRGDSRDFWNADGFEILSPTPQLVADADTSHAYNNASYVIRVRHATSTVLLAGDVEETAWQDMIHAGVDLRSNVLVASHHGRKSGFSQEAMDQIKPLAVVVSTAKLPPQHDGISDYKRLCTHVFSTRIDGDIQIRMHDNGDLILYDRDASKLVGFSDRC